MVSTHLICRPFWPSPGILFPLIAELIVQLFFDDEHRNYETESLGVTMQLVPPKGTDRRLFKEGLALWRARRGIKVVEE
jgi:hypothetical protein